MSYIPPLDLRVVENVASTDASIRLLLAKASVDRSSIPALVEQSKEAFLLSEKISFDAAVRRSGGPLEGLLRPGQPLQDPQAVVAAGAQKVSLAAAQRSSQLARNPAGRHRIAAAVKKAIVPPESLPATTAIGSLAYGVGLRSRGVAAHTELVPSEYTHQYTGMLNGDKPTHRPPRVDIGWPVAELRRKARPVSSNGLPFSEGHSALSVASRSSPTRSSPPRDVGRPSVVDFEAAKLVVGALSIGAFTAVDLGRGRSSPAPHAPATLSVLSMGPPCPIVAPRVPSPLRDPVIQSHVEGNVPTPSRPGVQPRLSERVNIPPLAPSHVPPTVMFTRPTVAVNVISADKIDLSTQQQPAGADPANSIASDAMDLLAVLGDIASGELVPGKTDRSSHLSEAARLDRKLSSAMLKRNKSSDKFKSVASEGISTTLPSDVLELSRSRKAELYTDFRRRLSIGDLSRDLDPKDLRSGSVSALDGPDHPGDLGPDHPGDQASFCLDTRVFEHEDSMPSPSRTGMQYSHVVRDEAPLEPSDGGGYVVTKSGWKVKQASTLQVHLAADLPRGGMILLSPAAIQVDQVVEERASPPFPVSSQMAPVDDAAASPSSEVLPPPRVEPVRVLPVLPRLASYPHAISAVSNTDITLLSSDEATTKLRGLLLLRP